MVRSVRNNLMLVLALVAIVFAIGADAQFGGCNLNIGPVQGCLPSAPNMNKKISAPCCKVFRSIDLSCICPFQLGGMPTGGFEPLLAIGVATGCYLPTPFICT